MITHELVQRSPASTQNNKYQEFSLYSENRSNDINFTNVYGHSALSHYNTEYINTTHINPLTREIWTTIQKPRDDLYGAIYSPYISVDGITYTDTGNYPDIITYSPDSNHQNRQRWDYSEEWLNHCSVEDKFNMEMGVKIQYENFNDFQEDFYIEAEIGDIETTSTISSRESLVLNLVSGLKVQGENHTTVTKNWSGHQPFEIVPQQNAGYTTTPEYASVYITPEPLDRYNGNETVAKVYVKNPPKRTPGYGIATLDDIYGTMHSTGNKERTERIVFDKAETVKTTGDWGNPLYLVGEIKVADAHYYDYWRNQTTTVNNGIFEQKAGSVVPYNFSGTYTRNLRFKINDNLDDINLTINYDIPTPLLDDDGEGIEINIRSNESEIPIKEIPKMYFSIEDIEMIKDNNYTLHELLELLNK